MDLPVGQMVGRYRVDGVIGRGPSGVVHRAQQDNPQRTVALKVMSAELSADPGFRDRFGRAAEVIASRQHPNVLPVDEIGEVEGRLFAVSRFVQGSSLATALAAGPIAPARAVRIVERVAAALESAHAAALFHGNLKPANVLLSGAGEDEHVYLADFGLPHPAGDYVAPEQVSGAAADARADVYSLGRLLAAALTGQPDAVRAGVPLPPGFPELLATATAADPAARFVAPGVFARAAAAALSAKAAGPAFPPIAATMKPAPAAAAAPPAPVPAPPPAPAPVAVPVAQSSGVPPWWVIAGVATVAAAIVLAALLLRDTGGGDLQRAAATPAVTASPTATPEPTPDAAEQEAAAARRRRDARRRREARAARERRRRSSQGGSAPAAVPEVPTGGSTFHTGTDPGESVPAAYCRMSPGELYCWTPNDGYTLRLAGGVARRVHSDEAANRGRLPGGYALLSVGETRSAFGHTCTSRSSGLSCQSAQGGGWSLPRYRGEASIY